MTISIIKSCKVKVVHTLRGYMVFDHEAEALQNILESEGIEVTDFDAQGCFFIPEGQFEQPSLTGKIPPSKIRALGKMLEMASEGRSI